MTETNAAILIDLWQEKYEDYRNGEFSLSEDPVHPVLKKRKEDIPQYKLTENIKNFIESRKDIEYVILASYDIKHELDSKIDWYENTRRYLDDWYDVKIKKRHLIEGKEATDKRILFWKTNKKKLAFHFLWEIKLFLKKEKINALYYCGESWETCVAQRPVGYDSVSKFCSANSIPTKIRVKNNCVLTENNRYFEPEKNTKWVPIYTDEFELRS